LAQIHQRTFWLEKSLLLSPLPPYTEFHHFAPLCCIVPAFMQFQGLYTGANIAPELFVKGVTIL
jgi:hypothetical protein